MANNDRIHHYVERAASLYGDYPAIEEPGKGSISYAALRELANDLSTHLASLGVSRGDRVGIYMRKSIDAIASIMGILKTGAAYVPVDPIAPASRNGYILNDCSVKVV